jgi:signal transduction histidine kinase
MSIYDVLSKVNFENNSKLSMDELEEGFNKISKGTLVMYASEFGIYQPSPHPQRDFFDLQITGLRKESSSDLLGFILTIRDISDRKAAEISLQERNRMHELVLRLLSHDLRGHLFTLQGYAEIAKASQNLDEIHESFEAVEIKGKAIVKLIDEVTGYLQAQTIMKSQELERYNLCEIITELLEQLRPETETKNISMQYDCLKEEQGDAIVLANLTIKSVFNNLLQNCLKFTPEYGNIIIQLSDAGSNWRVSIEDSGPGIPDELKEQVFEPFAAFGSKAGTGLGLTIVWETIHNLHGTIWIEDVKPTGSRFVFTIPKFKN